MGLFRNEEHVGVKEVARKGLSLFARHDFKKGDVVFVVSGKIVSYATDYTIPIDHELKIEPRVPGNEAQFMNHSCEPNIGVLNRSLFVAMRDIVKGEEVVTNYAFLGYEYGHEMTIDGEEKKEFDRTCKCGALNCKGILQSYKTMPPEERNRYREYISEYLLDDMRYPYIPE